MRQSRRALRAALGLAGSPTQGCAVLAGRLARAGLVPSLLRSVIAVRTAAGGGLLGLCSAAAGRHWGFCVEPLPPRTLVLALYAAEDAAARSRAAPAPAGRQWPVIQRRRTTAAGGGGGGGGIAVVESDESEREWPVIQRRRAAALRPRAHAAVWPAWGSGLVDRYGAGPLAAAVVSVAALKWSASPRRRVPSGHRRV